MTLGPARSGPVLLMISSETVDMLRRHGVDYGQGFHLGMPVPVSAMLAR